MPRGPIKDGPDMTDRIPPGRRRGEPPKRVRSTTGRGARNYGEPQRLTRRYDEPGRGGKRRGSTEDDRMSGLRAWLAKNRKK